MDNIIPGVSTIKIKMEDGKITHMVTAFRILDPDKTKDTWNQYKQEIEMNAAMKKAEEDDKFDIEMEA
jgi:hypothetical protein